ncbi:hypothetical protein [Brevibacillus sp. SYSU BS000544]|uniref:hypothetical protein n=1 Tax=Brevibacillus sp. SYSU BS000544 TaxID=3416443 RepID=UPI003CE4EFCF
MKEIINKRINHYNEVIKQAAKNGNYLQAYEGQLLRTELEKLLEMHEVEFDLERTIDEYYYSSMQVAKKINKSHTTVIRQVQKGKLRGIIVGRDYFFLKKYIDNEIANR